MKTVIRFAVATAMVIAMALPILAADQAEQAAKTAPKDTPKELHHQTLCPVMGGPIDSTAFTDIQGQRVYHCCPMCSEKLKADPDKYFKEAAAQGVLFENVQTACPVSGEELDKSVYTDYEGRRIYFCCEKCIATFNEDPAGYLSKLDENNAAQGEESTRKDSEHDMSKDHMEHHQ